MSYARVGNRGVPRACIGIQSISNGISINLEARDQHLWTSIISLKISIWMSGSKKSHKYRLPMRRVRCLPTAHTWLRFLSSNVQMFCSISFVKQTRKQWMLLLVSTTSAIRGTTWLVRLGDVLTWYSCCLIYKYRWSLGHTTNVYEWVLHAPAVFLVEPLCAM